MNTVKNPDNIIVLKDVVGYGIYDIELGSFIGLRTKKYRYDRKTAAIVEIEDNSFKSIWHKPSDAKSAFKYHTGTSIKDVSDRYKVIHKL